MVRKLPLGLVILGLFLFSCAPARTFFSDRVQLLPDTTAHKKLTELLKILPKKKDAEADELFLTWIKWLDNLNLPLADDQTLTFVYYDFPGTAARVDLEANFMDGKSVALTRAPGTRLYYKVFKVPKPEKILYDFKVSSPAGEVKLTDPFNVFALPGNPPQSRTLDWTLTTGQRNYISSTANPDLKGQNIILYLPPFYERNLARSYPVIYLVGLPEGAWESAVEQKIQSKEIQPVIMVYIDQKEPDRAGLESTLISNIKPWVERHYRTLSDKDNTMLVGWDQAAKPAADLKSAHPDVFGKLWIDSPKNDPQFTDQLWLTKGADMVKSFFPAAEFQP